LLEGVNFILDARGFELHKRVTSPRKKQPNYKSCWEKEGSLFHCPIISNIMSRTWFTQLRRCLHITNLALYEHIQKGDFGYDKLRQVRWLIDVLLVVGSGP
jgi:hypothetical protein